MKTQLDKINPAPARRGWVKNVKLGRGGGPINDGRVCACSGGCRNRQGRPLLRGSLLQQSSLSWLITSLRWVDRETSNDERETYNSKNYSQQNRKPFEEITCHAYGKKGYTHIGNSAGNKFTTFVGEDIFHRRKSISFKERFVKVKEPKPRKAKA